MNPRIAETVFRWLSRLPPGWLDALARPLGWLLSLAGRRRRVTLRNIAACYPQLSSLERKRLMKSSCYEFSRTVLETAWIWSWPLDKLMARIESATGLDHLEAARDSGRGIIFAAPHLGAWEIDGLYLQTVSDMAILFKSPKDPSYEPLLIEKRAKGGAKVLPVIGQGIRQAIRHVRAGGAVGILPDQQPTEGDGVFAPFFGVPTWTGTFLPKLARRTGAVVLFSFCERLPGAARYKVHFLPAEEAIYSADEVESVCAMNRGVEACIEINRPQWLWAYKRFRIRPPGDAPFYSSSA